MAEVEALPVHMNPHFFLYISFSAYVYIKVMVAS